MEAIWQTERFRAPSTIFWKVQGKQLIGRLVGNVVSTGESSLVLDVSGVGYDVQIPLGTLGRTENRSDSAPVTLSVHTHVRQDCFELFGFATDAERGVFRLLIATPNVGPKMALNILGSLPPAELANAVANQDLTRLRKIGGVGKKTAERLLLELKEKLPAFSELPAAAATTQPSGDADRLLGALTNMGYKPQQAERAVESLGARVGEEPLSDLLKLALAELA